MKFANISEAKASLSKIIEQVRRGEEVILAKAGKPVAKIVPYHGPEKRTLGGSWEGRVQMADDFDDFVPPAIAEAFGIDT